MRLLYALSTGDTRVTFSRHSTRDAERAATARNPKTSGQKVEPSDRTACRIMLVVCLGGGGIYAEAGLRDLA